MAALLLLVAAVDAPSASAAKPTGKPVAELSVGKAGRGLRGRGVRVRRVKPVVIRRGLAGFPISDVNVSGARGGTFVLRGTLLYRRGSRKVRLTGMLVKVRGRNFSITGKLNGKRMKVFYGRTTKSAVVDGGRVALSFKSRKVLATKRAMRRVARKLKTRTPRSRYVGKFGGSAFVVAPPPGAVTTIPGDDARRCLPGVAAVTDPARPATAVDIGCAYIIWHMRDSWIAYSSINSPIAPAAALPAIPASQHVCPDAGGNVVDTYSLRVPFASGWWDPASGKAALFSVGGVHFIDGAGHFNIKATDLEVRIDGAGSTLRFTVTNSLHPFGKRIAFVSMNAAAPSAGGPVAPGTPLTRLRGKLTSAAITDFFEGVSYSAGTSFGCVDFGFDF